MCLTVCRSNIFYLWKSKYHLWQYQSGHKHESPGQGHVSPTGNASWQNAFRRKMPQPKKPWMPVSLTGCTLSLVFLPLCGYCEWSVSAKVDPITFPITTEPSPGKQTLEKVLPRDVSISLVCCQVATQVSVAMIISRCYGSSLFLEVCVYSGFSDPHKAERIDNRLHELGHAGQTNTGASRTGKPDNQPESWVLRDTSAGRFYLGFKMLKILSVNCCNCVRVALLAVLQKVVSVRCFCFVGFWIFWADMWYTEVLGNLYTPVF